MPALPDVPGVIKVRLIWQLGGGDLAGCQLFFNYTGTAPTSAACASAASTIGAEAATQFGGLYPSSVILEECIVTDLSSHSGGEGTATVGTAGTRSGEQLPGGNAVLVNYQISRRYRGGKPRNYFPFGVGADLGNQIVWTTGFISSVESAIGIFDSFMAGLAIGTATVEGRVNVSFYDGFTSVENPVTHRWRNIPTPRTDPLVDVVTGSTVAEKLGTQRRRYDR